MATNPWERPALLDNPWATDNPRAALEAQRDAMRGEGLDEIYQEKKPKLQQNVIFTKDGYLVKMDSEQKNQVLVTNLKLDAALTTKDEALRKSCAILKDARSLDVTFEDFKMYAGICFNEEKDLQQMKGRYAVASAILIIRRGV